ncbi:pectinesterase-like [Abrus precatorius]|uniref:Pectinesterase n=1 Tax=Abrus precatorius TaxID=3816 RepID=A0A8B8KRZ0_ABRPR|nr:pectinesterase-like [Abrus precatorius]
MSGEGDAQKGRRIAIMGVSALLLVAMVVAAVTVRQKDGSDNETEDNKNRHVASTVKAVQTFCHPTDYKKECEESLVTVAGNTTDPKELIKIAFNVTIAKIENKIKDTDLMHEVEKEPRAKMALETCKQLMNLSIEELRRSLDGIGEFDLRNLEEILMNLKVWLSGAVTYQDTCLDGFENSTSEASKRMEELLTQSMHMSSNILAIVTELADSVADWNVTQLLGRRLLLEHSDDRRRILDAFKLKPNVTVAMDGSGDCRSVNEALKKVPEENERPFVIYIKEGIYPEYVEVTEQMTHVFFVGDGGKRTRITGHKNFIDGINTYKTATVAIQGNYFVAINMGFENSAGPEKHQAVALRVQGDKSIFYNCSMDGYQDTLYVHTMRQFYRDCTISGTIDFVFGNALAVFQNCTFVVRKPMKNQQCIVTAQGRKERQQPSAIVIQGGSIVSDPEFYPVRFENKAYLARPWKNYSRTVVMDTYIDDLIHPDGYLPWQGPEGPTGMDTCFYVEYHNTGPGSDKLKRVNWAGIWNLNSKAARLFAPSKFFHGSDWIEDIGIPYYPGVPDHHRHKKTILPW